MPNFFLLTDDTPISTTAGDIKAFAVEAMRAIKQDENKGIEKGKYYTVPQACKLLNISNDILYRHLNTPNGIKASRIGGKGRWRIKGEELLKFIYR